MVTVPRDEFSAEWHRLAPIIYQDSRYSFFIAADASSVRQDSGVVVFIPFHPYIATAMEAGLNTTVMDDADFRYEDPSRWGGDARFVAFGSMIARYTADTVEEE
jgi:hypothetical protein